MKAFLLAAGKGKRLLPFTEELPKPLYKVLGKPLIQWNIEKLRDAGFSQIVINVHHLADKLVDVIGDGSKFDLEISYSFERELLGTGGGVGNALDLIGGDPFVLLSGDLWTNYNFQSLELAPNSLAHMVLVSNLGKDEGDVFLNQGRLNIHGKGEKYTFSGIAVLDPKLFTKIKKKNYQLWESVLLPACEENLITGEFYMGDLFNINSLEEAERLDAFLTRE